VFQEVETPRFQDNRYMKLVRLSALHTGRFHPQEIFLVLIPVRGLIRTQGHSAAGRITSTKNSRNPIANRTRGLPACSAVPHPTAPLGAPFYVTDVLCIKLIIDLIPTKWLINALCTAQ